jgi:hypothetical protein
LDRERRGERTVGVILVANKGTTGLDLRLQDGIPELLSRDLLALTVLRFVLQVQSLKLGTVDFMKTWSLIGAKEGPLFAGLDTTHATKNMISVIN